MNRFEILRARQIALWNAIVPACAKAFEYHPTHVRYLHPTKGWRAVSNRRLGI